MIFSNCLHINQRKHGSLSLKEWNGIEVETILFKYVSKFKQKNYYFVNKLTLK